MAIRYTSASGAPYELVSLVPFEKLYRTIIEIDGDAPVPFRCRIELDIPTDVTKMMTVDQIAEEAFRRWTQIKAQI
jgi:hypothetical protein